MPLLFSVYLCKLREGISKCIAITLKTNYKQQRVLPITINNLKMDFSTWKNQYFALIFISSKHAIGGLLAN